MSQSRISWSCLHWPLHDSSGAESGPMATAALKQCWRGGIAVRLAQKALSWNHFPVPACCDSRSLGACHILPGPYFHTLSLLGPTRCPALLPSMECLRRNLCHQGVHGNGDTQITQQ